MICLTFNFCFAQETDTKKLKFILEGTIINVEHSDVGDSTVISNASIIIKGTDSSSVELKSDSNGFFRMLLKPETSYTFIVDK